MGRFRPRAGEWVSVKALAKHAQGSGFNLLNK
jgi:hypothetical protein